MRRLPLAIWLVVAWVALWDDLSLANVIGGACVAAFLLAVLPTVPAPRRTPKRLTVRPLRLLHLLGYLAFKLVEANYVVAREVLTPGEQIVEGVVAVRVRSESDTFITLLSNATGLMPGTLVLEVEPCEGGSMLYIHVLHLHDIEQVRREVRHLEDLALRALVAKGSS